MAPESTHHDQVPMAFGLIFFASSEAPYTGESDKYRLVMESARFADQHGFSSIWIPERHFTKDGWLYPNPAVLQAAIARETRQIQLRAGSVVMPLHHPARVAEEWAMVDNLSGGRVGLAFASGWHPNDFVFAPERYSDRTEEMYRGIALVQRLWRGEAIQAKSGDGKLVEIRTYPTPVQRDLPIWITAAGNPKTFARAGEIGANVLTHLYNHNIDELAERIQLYRQARAQHGHDAQAGQVAVMIHTFIWENEGAELELARTAFRTYLISAAYLFNAIAYSRGQKVDLASLSEQDVAEYLEFVMHRLISEQRVLIGTPESTLPAVSRLLAAGATEIACQIDFGVEADLALQNLHYVDQLKNLSRQKLSSSPPVASSSARFSTSSVSSFSSSSFQQGQAEQMQRSGSAGEAEPSYERSAAVSVQSRQQDTGLQAVRERCREEVALEEFYGRLQRHGIQLTAGFQSVRQLWRRDGEALGRVQLPEALEEEAAAYYVHPALLDSSLQVLIAALPATAGKGEEEALYLPMALDSFQIHRQPGRLVWSHATLRSGAQEETGVFKGDVELLDEAGQVLVEARGLRLQRSMPVTPTVQPMRADEQLFYELRWEPASLDEVPLLTGRRTWLIFMDGGGVGQELARLLAERGDTCIKVFAGYSFQVLQPGVQYSINPARPQHMQHLLEELQTAGVFPLHNILHLWSLDMAPPGETSSATLDSDQALGTGSALSLLQALVAQYGERSGQGGEHLRLWLVTHGAQAAGPAVQQLSIAQSPLWGFGRTCAIEHPELWGGLIDVDPQESASFTAAQLLDILSRQHKEDQIAFRQGQLYVARLVRADSEHWSGRTVTIRSDASYLISGGLWGLGLEVARWLAQKGARHLVLLGRTILPPRADWDTVPPDSRTGRQIAALRELEAAGVRVHYGAVDVANELQLSAFRQELSRQGCPPVRGIMHAASVWQDRQGQSLVRPLIQLDQAAVKAVFDPKVVGTWNLHKLFQDDQLDFFVLFSSGASLIGSAAQGNYAAAGAFLDAFAHYLRSKGQPALSVDWGAVSGKGFGATQEGLRVHEYWESHGIQRITPEQVLAALALLIPQQVAQIGVLKLDWHLLQQFYPQLVTLPLFTYLVSGEADAQPARAEATKLGEHPLLASLASVQAEERQHLVEAYLCEKIAGVLRLPASSIDVQQPVTTLGLDSLMSIELKNKIELELSIHIPIVTLLQGPSIHQFATQLLYQLAEVIVPASTTSTASTATEQVPAEQQATPQAPTQGSKQADAEQLLAQLDQLSDEEVNTLLSSFLPPQPDVPSQSEEHALPSHTAGKGLVEVANGPAQGQVSQQDAAHLLTNIEQLSDNEVDSLLSHILQQEEDHNQ
ncbi:MAG: LLM class flavin-dependent oxidoreductase [Ktedonobacteraceae bacterium]|nr:LLM class flavin-dependent oxidoreductase [Ktedonobacteraceae bacterium]